VARNDIRIAASPERVFAILSDSGSYAEWVVGSSEVRDADPGWPALGTKFHHRVGLGPLSVVDNTQVVGADPPNRLVLHARARPLGTSRVEIRLAPEDGGTRVTMVEEAGDVLTRIAFNPLTDHLVRARNLLSLRRLRRLVEASA
jgi:uncharacterized protein YndB with AHSA1/START domain